MEELYIPLDKAAIFEGMTYIGYKSRIYRNPSAFIFKRIPNGVESKTPNKKR